MAAEVDQVKQFGHAGNHRFAECDLGIPVARCVGVPAVIVKPELAGEPVVSTTIASAMEDAQSDRLRLTERVLNDDREHRPAARI